MNVFEIMKNIKSKFVQLSAQVLVVTAVLGITFFLLLADYFKTYQSEIFILVSPKSQVALSEQGQLIDNIVEIPKTLSFYEKVLKYNPDMSDVAVGSTLDEKKTKWNKLFQIEKVNDSASVFKIRITTSYQSDSEQIAQKTTRTLFDTIALYYDIQKDFDLRIIDGPITKSLITAWQLLLLVAFLCAFVVANLLNNFLLKGKQVFVKNSENLKYNFFANNKEEVTQTSDEEMTALQDLYQEESVYDDYVEKIEEMKAITKKMENDKYPNFAEMPALEVRKSAGAPFNLPIAEDDFFEGYSLPQEAPLIKESVSVVEEIKAEQIDTTTEPTAEQLKKRLNDLLQGKI